MLVQGLQKTVKGRRVPEAYVPLCSRKIPLWVQYRQYDLDSVNIFENLLKTEVFFSMSNTNHVNFLSYKTMQNIKKKHAKYRLVFLKFLSCPLTFHEGMLTRAQFQ